MIPANANDNVPRWVCGHEAGHAIVIHSFNLRVETVCVCFDKIKGHWFGRTTHAADDDLPIADQITNLVAGKAAEEFFESEAPHPAWLEDFGKISSLLHRKGISDAELRLRINQGKVAARTILEKYRAEALRLIDLLLERRRVDRPELLRLMNGET